MAKNRSTFFDISGTIDGFTFVHTRNGRYVRKPRGTFKKAVCNDQLKSVTNRNGIVNHAAKLVHNTVKNYAGVFKQSNLWQQILKRIRQSDTDDLLSLLTPVVGLEVNQLHTFASLSDAKSEVTTNGRVITISVKCTGGPFFKAVLSVDCYYYELYILFIDAGLKSLAMESVDSGWLAFEHPKAVFEISFAAPAGAKYFVVLLKIQGGSREQEIGDFRAMGIRVEGVGLLAESDDGG